MTVHACPDLGLFWVMVHALGNNLAEADHNHSQDAEASHNLAEDTQEVLHSQAAGQRHNARSAPRNAPLQDR